MLLGDAATWAGVLVAGLVGAGGVVVGIVGITQARSAHREAERANAAADEANRLARAGLIGDDVWWTLEWQAPGLAELKNNGHDHPRNARGQVTVDDETVSFAVESPDAEGITLPFPGARVALALERQALDGPSDPMKMGYSINHVDDHTVAWRVTWDTALGRTMPTDVQFHTNQAIVPFSTTPPGMRSKQGFAEID